MPLRLSSAAPAKSIVATSARISCLCLALAPFGVAGIGPARAQAIALSVNGDPVTNVDLEQRMKLLRGLPQASGRARQPWKV